MVCGLESTADPTVRQLFSSCVGIASPHVVASPISMHAERRRCVLVNEAKKRRWNPETIVTNGRRGLCHVRMRIIVAVAVLQ